MSLFHVKQRSSVSCGTSRTTALGGGLPHGGGTGQQQRCLSAAHEDRHPNSSPNVPQPKPPTEQDRLPAKWSQCCPTLTPPASHLQQATEARTLQLRLEARRGGRRQNRSLTASEDHARSHPRVHVPPRPDCPDQQPERRRVRSRSGVNWNPRVAKSFLSVQLQAKLPEHPPQYPDQHSARPVPAVY